LRGASREERHVSPRLDAAARVLQRDRSEDLRSFRVTALGFKVAVGGPRPIAVAYAVDAEGVEHWLAVRSATRGVELTYLDLLSDLLARGLRSSGTLIVDSDGSTRLGLRLERALGPVVYAGLASEWRASDGRGLAW
jgi:hypothetical protein